MKSTQSVALRGVFVTVSTLLTDVIKEMVSSRVTFDVVAEFCDRESLGLRLPALAPDIVLIGLFPGETDAIGPTLLKFVPGAKVIAVSSDGRQAYLHEMRKRRAQLFDFSPSALIAAILGADPTSSA